MATFRTTLWIAATVCAFLLADVAWCPADTSGNTAASDGRVTLELASRAASRHLARFDDSGTFTLGEGRASADPADAAVLYYQFDLEPTGFIVVSASADLPPVIAYSFTGACATNETGSNPLADLLLPDLHSRMQNIAALPADVIERHRAAWARLADAFAEETPATTGGDWDTDRLGFQQWPPPGSTTTGGWVETHWDQGSPYNQACPTDPVTAARSIAGCPAVAIAQILNYHRRLNGTSFSNADDYHHVYSGRNYWIDNDYLARGFPSFPQLNTRLNTLFGKYFHGTALANADRAALIFACGVAAQQVYTSSGSGTFAVSQALDAFRKFGCDTAELLYQESPGPYERLTQNMIAGYPALLAVVNADWTSGHNLVVDGYNTDGYYHLNFGWSGSYDAWYRLPSEMPFSLTVIEGLIVDILIDACRPMDCNCDGIVNASDFTYFAECLSGPAAAWGAPGCAAFDADEDADSDLADFAAFQRLFGDPGN
jgi:hypothetical protein